MIWKFGRSRSTAEPGTIGGPARLDGRTKNLTKRLSPGEVAIIDERLAASCHGVLPASAYPVARLIDSLPGVAG